MNKPSFKLVGYKDVKCGKNVTIVNPCNIYGCKLGDEVFIGPFVEIQCNVEIGNNTKVQSHSFICEMVSIGSECFVGHGVMFINDRFTYGGPAKGDRALWAKTSIGNHVSIGSNATIMPVEICDYVVIGAGSVVTKDILQAGIYAGNPAQKIREV